MLIYEYLPYEFVRLGVVWKAAGLDLSTVAAQVCLAQERSGNARLVPREPQNLSELLIAELRRRQWERIASLMNREGMATYAPSRDARARRYEPQGLQRLANDVAKAERSGVGTVQIERHRVPASGRQPGRSPCLGGRRQRP
ncbi:hypothetical protein [Streptomyces sp. NPDC059371]|uniref:hypothetical protein n=1 Tax=Streptomyces sp. NPDC059371 TaxID=3346812 RepID=UPI0036A3E90C